MTSGSGRIRAVRDRTTGKPRRPGSGFGAGAKAQGHGHGKPGQRGPARIHTTRRAAAADEPEDKRGDFRVLGWPAVEAVFARDAASVERLFLLPEMQSRAHDFCARLAAARKPFRVVEADELARVAGTGQNGGICAIAAPPRVQPLPVERLADWAEDGQPLFVLDGVSNPHNLGAIARTLAFFGYKRLVLSDHAAQAMPSEAAVRVAEGGLHRLSLYGVRDMRWALEALRLHFRIVGTALDIDRPVTPATLDRRQPIALLLGNEEHGLPRETLEGCDDCLTVPGSGWVQSLNVSATAAILAHSLMPVDAMPASPRPTPERKPPSRSSAERKPGERKPPERKPTDRKPPGRKPAARPSRRTESER